MKFYKLDIKKKIIFLVMIPIFIIIAVILGRKIVIPTNDEIINELKNTKMYTCNVEYTFINARDNFKENTKQYYRYDKGGRIEFDDYYRRIKIYNGEEIKLQIAGKDYRLNKNIDSIYPLSFIENILSYSISEPIEELNEEWGEGEYLKLNIDYGNDNRYLKTGEFYIDKNKRIPVALKVYDQFGNERILIKYNNFKYEKIISAGLFE